MKAKLTIVLTLALLLLVFAGCQSANTGLQTPPVDTAAGQQTTDVIPPADTQNTNPVSAVPETTAPIVPISKDSAILLALKHAGLKNEDVTRLYAEYDFDDGVGHYDVDFRHGDYDYDYEVHGQSGEILKSEKEYDPVDPPAPTTLPQVQQPTAKPDVKLSKADAQKIALEHAGLTSDSVRSLHVEYDWDDGYGTYEVEFKKDGFEYNYEIHANSGKILDADKERDD